MTIENHEKILAALRVELNTQTAEYPWVALQRQFAAGSVVAVAAALDLVDVGAHIAADDKFAVQRWMAAGQLGQVTDAQAAVWLAEDALLWTVVVKPWILVQKRRVPPLH
jgi:hypothetical protein